MSFSARPGFTPTKQSSRNSNIHYGCIVSAAGDHFYSSPARIARQTTYPARCAGFQAFYHFPTKIEVTRKVETRSSHRQNHQDMCYGLIPANIRIVSYVKPNNVMLLHISAFETKAPLTKNISSLLACARFFNSV